MRKLILFFILTTLLSACGRKGALVPPEALVPAAISDLKGEQKGKRLLLSWTPPTREVGRGPLRGPVGFLLYRRDVLPPGEDCEECLSAYRLVKELPSDYPGGVPHSAGRVHVDDTDLAVERTYQYKVVSFRQDGAPSPPSNRLRRRILSPPQAPVATALSSAAGVELTWTAVLPSAGSTVKGYNVYRHRKGAPVPLAPLNPLPVDGFRYEDLLLEQNTSYDYGIRTVSDTAGTTVESELSAEVTGRLE